MADDLTLPQLIAGQAQRRPEAIAIRQWADSMTYAELCATASTLGAELAERPDVLIGVCADRHPPMVAGLLGVLWSGAGYVPLDASLPAARLHAIAVEAGLRTIVCDPVGAELFAGTGLDLLSIPDSPTTQVDFRRPQRPDATAYVMFTSGSTGRPKGVVIPNRALSEFVTSMAAVAGMDQESRSLAISSIGFDASVIDVLTPLAVGATVALAGSADRADPARLQRFCAEHQVTVAFLPPALLPLLDPDGLADLRVVLTGSEAPGPEQVARWTTAGRRFFNLYGPTEMTVLVTWFEATGTWVRPLPIGCPAANHRVYLVDDQMRLVPPGEPGEVLAGGAGIADGYLGSPDLTAQRFVPDPFSEIPGARLYRTGDLASMSPDGTLQFIGRADRQIKIRGQRIEIGEIEAVLRGHPDVTHAAVAAVPGIGGLQLVAFVTGDVTPQVLRAYCGERLAAAAVPGRVLALAELPQLSSGKVDLGRLIELVPSTNVDGKPFEPPATEVEEQLAEIWADLLELPRVGRDDDFFDGGGHSITAMRLVAAMRAKLRRDVSIEDVMGGRTVRAIAARASQAAALGEDRPVRGRPPALSPSQQRLWFLDRYSPEAAAAYNITMAERLRGPLDVTAMEAALVAVAERQQILRWGIPEVGGVPQAVLADSGPVPLPVDNLSALPPAEQERELDARLAAGISKRFDLAHDPLWRNRLYVLGPDDHVLAITAHHAVFDGWSQSLLYDDLAKAYRGLPLEPLPATYADYVAWRDERRDQRGAGDLAWWVSHLEGARAVLELPGDHPRPQEQTFAGASVSRWLDRATTADLGRYARVMGATPSAVLLAALGIVLAGQTGQTDMVIGSPMVDRRHADFEEMVGFFIEIAPLRLRMDSDRGFAEHVRAARDELLAALAHPEAPLERIVQAFGLGGQLSRNPVVQVLFNMFNFAAPGLDLAGLASEPVPVQVPGSAFDLTVYGVEHDSRMRIDIVYNTDLFKASRMDGLLDSLIGVIEQGLADGTADVPSVTTVHGEVLRPVRRDAPITAEAPKTPTEQAIAAIWRDVLEREIVGATDNFFDSGGGSLAIVVVQQRLNQMMGRDLRVVDLFRYPTVRTLAEHLDRGDSSSDATDAAVELAARRGAARRDRSRRRPSGQNERDSG